MACRRGLDIGEMEKSNSGLEISVIYCWPLSSNSFLGGDSFDGLADVERISVLTSGSLEK